MMMVIVGREVVETRDGEQIMKLSLPFVTSLGDGRLAWRFQQLYCDTKSEPNFAWGFH